MNSGHHFGAREDFIHKKNSTMPIPTNERIRVLARDAYLVATDETGARVGANVESGAIDKFNNWEGICDSICWSKYEGRFFGFSEGFSVGTVGVVIG